MQARTARFDTAVRNSQTKISTAVHQNLVTGDSTTLTIEDGSVTIDRTSAIRRTLTLTVPSTQATWDALDTVGGEITVTQGFKYTDNTIETVPLGVFVVDQDQIGYGPGDTIQLTCPDRWIKVQRNGFNAASRASVPSNMAWQEIKRLVEGAWPGGTYLFPGWATGSPGTSATTKVGSLLWDDGNRESAINSIAADNSVEVFFDATGLAVLRPIPVLTSTSIPVWTVAAGQAGVMVSADRTRDRSSVRNAMIVTTSATDVTFNPVEVKNTTVGDPLNVAGPLGYVPMDISSSTLRNSAQAGAYGYTQLALNLGIAKQLSLEAVGNPAQDAEDVILVVLPKIDANTSRPNELHICDTVTTPLVPSGTQAISTRSTRPASDGF
jgi:kumamolisin